MKRNIVLNLFLVGLATFLILALSGSSLAQGKGKGKTKDNPTSQSKGKKNNDPLWDGSDKKKDKPNANNNGSQRFRGLSKKTGYSQSKLEARYEIERSLNPNLTYGQFVAAHMIAKNHKGISTGDILGGLRNGRSIGQVLQDRKWDRKRIDRERNRIRDIFKDDDLYDDLDPDWRF